MSVLKKMSKNSANDRVYSLTWSLDDGEDVPKRFSTPNYLQFAPNLVKIGAGSPELQKLECFEEDEQEFSKYLEFAPIFLTF